jgi:hypothetical protein
MPLTEEQAFEAERYEKLSAAAFERFKTRLDWEWKARLALWTVLALATGLVVSREKWELTNVEIGCAVALALLVIGLYWFLFANPVHELHQLDIRDRMEFDWKVRQICDPALANQPVPGDPARAEHAKWLSWGQLAITAVFGIAFIVAVLTKSPAPSASPSKVTIEGRESSSISIVPPK